MTGTRLINLMYSLRLPLLDIRVDSLVGGMATIDPEIGASHEAAGFTEEEKDRTSVLVRR